MHQKLRSRPLERPIITRQIIYNHHDQHIQTGSQPSFLKMSENASKQLNHDHDPFNALEMKLNSFQQKSALKLHSVKMNILQMERNKKRLVDHELIENKENLRMAYRRIPLHDQHSMKRQECNFQMDENFNYVKNAESSERYGSAEGQGSLKIIGNEFCSLGNSRGQETTQRINRPRSGSVVESRLSTRRSSSRLQPKKKTVCSQSLQNQKKTSSLPRGRIYQEILSLYSIPKLLAMQPKMK